MAITVLNKTDQQLSCSRRMKDAQVPIFYMKNNSSKLATFGVDGK